MNTETQPNDTAVTVAEKPVRPFYWSVWREIWENRALSLAPLVVATVVLFGTVVMLSNLPQRRHSALALEPMARRAAIELPYDMAAVMILLTAFIVGLFYCLDALYGERRERSILFWKSLPVSDLTSVLAKMTIPLVVLPIISFVVIIITQFVMMLLSSVALLPSGLAGTTWANFNLFREAVVLLYALVVLVIWHAPVYGWALLISAWVRRASFLWALLPLLALQVFEKIAFGTWHVALTIGDRLVGFAPRAFEFVPRHGETIDSLTGLTPAKYLASPEVWFGLICAAAFVIAAVRLRRYRGPL